MAALTMFLQYFGENLQGGKDFFLVELSHQNSPLSSGLPESRSVKAGSSSYWALPDSGNQDEHSGQTSICVTLFW